MSTRGMIGIRAAGKLLGTYNHFDSYPEGLGAEMVQFAHAYLNGPEEVALFKAKVLKLKVVRSDAAPSKDALKFYNKQGLTSELGDARRGASYYGLLRSFQGVAGLKAILHGEARHWIDNKRFIQDSLFCEYAYIFNLDEGKLEFYKGFQKTGKKSKNKKFGYESDVYGPCKKVGAISFTAVTVEGMNALYVEEPKDE